MKITFLFLNGKIQQCNMFSIRMSSMILLCFVNNLMYVYKFSLVFDKLFDNVHISEYLRGKMHIFYLEKQN